MPSKKKKYNARFPAGRIKKIMQTDEEVGKVAQAVPVIISRTLELFVESLVKKTLEITTSRNARTLSPHHMKQCILSEKRFDFLRDLVKNLPEVSTGEEENFSITNINERRLSRSESNNNAENCKTKPSSSHTSEKTSENINNTNTVLEKEIGIQDDDDDDDDDMDPLLIIDQGAVKEEEDYDQ